MSAPTRIAASRLYLLRGSGSKVVRGFATTTAAKSSITGQGDEAWPQRTPLGDYYTPILNDPIPYPFNHKPEEPPTTAHPSVQPPHRRQKTVTDQKDKAKASASEAAETSPPQPAPPPKTAQEKARIIFGSRLLGPAEQADRLATKQAQSTYLGGVLVPPRPDEPDNCCMSGCVNCVWDRYREDMEEWSSKKNEAQARLKARSGTTGSGGGGSEANWGGVGLGKDKIAKDMWDDEVYQSVPVGIREFMKQEKRLKEKHAREGTLGG